MSLSLRTASPVLVLALALGALGFACSSSGTSTPSPFGGGGGTTTSPSPTAPGAMPQNEGEVVQPISPEEQALYNADEVCASQCFVDFAAGAQLMQDLDDCTVELCYGDEAEADTTTKACPAIGTGAGQVSYGLMERDRCLGRSCCDKAQACAGNAACSSLASCVARCNVRQ